MKKRVLAGNQQLLRLDWEKKHPITEEVENKLLLLFSSKIDTSWTDFFWSKFRKDNSIDDAYMRFIASIAMVLVTLERTKYKAEERIQIITKLQEDPDFVKPIFFSKEGFNYLFECFEIYNALENKEITLHSQIQLPKEGVWQIRATFSGQDWTSVPSFTKSIAVADGEAVSMVRRYLESSKIAYIGYFPYGNGYQKILDEEHAPVILELDIANAPLTGEDTLLTCRITSLNDVPDFFTHIRLFKRHQIKDIPSSSFLVNGSLEWQGELKKMTPVEFSAVIKFPEEGEWRIYAEGNSLLREEMELSGFEDKIKLTVTDEKSYYGWKPIDFQRSNFTGNDIPGINPFSDGWGQYYDRITSFPGWYIYLGIAIFLVVISVASYMTNKTRNTKTNIKTN